MAIHKILHAQTVAHIRGNLQGRQVAQAETILRFRAVQGEIGEFRRGPCFAPETICPTLRYPDWSGIQKYKITGGGGRAAVERIEFCPKLF